MPPPSTLPLSLLRSGTSLMSCGLLFGFLVGLTPYPRLGLTAHIQFMVEGAMVLGAGLLLNSTPFPRSSQRLADALAGWKQSTLYWGFGGVWVTLLSEVANAWWGARDVLPLAAEAAGRGERAAEWQEGVVSVAHYGPAVVLGVCWPIIVYQLFCGPEGEEKED